MSWPISSSFSCSNPSSTVSRTLPACHKPPDTPRHLAIVAPARRYLPQRHLPRTLAPTSPLRRRQDASPPARTSTKTLIPTNGTAILAPMGGGRGRCFLGTPCPRTSVHYLPGLYTSAGATECLSKPQTLSSTIAAASIIGTNFAAVRLAPPTSAPSTSPAPSRSAALSPVTDPP